MKKIVFLLIVLSLNLQAQFVKFEDNASKNRFLGLENGQIDLGFGTKGSSKGSLSTSEYGNGTITEFLKVNFLSPELLGRQFYMFNDFMYWMGENLDTGKADIEPEKYFSGSGVFMIVLGTSSYLKKIVAPEKTCPEGKVLLMAQLKYNNGSSLVTWSQDSVCLTPTDTFAIQINKTQDTTIPMGSVRSVEDAYGFDWMKDPGPSENYLQAGSSPRQIRLIVNSK